jgi:hypothetical protein
LPCDDLHRGRAAFECRPRGFSTKPFHELSGRNAGLGAKRPREVSRAHRRSSRKLLDAQRPLKLAADVNKEIREAAAGRRQLEEFGELRRAAGNTPLIA